MPAFSGREVYPQDVSMAEGIDFTSILVRWTPSGRSLGYSKKPCNINARGLCEREDKVLKRFVP